MNALVAVFSRLGLRPKSGGFGLRAPFYRSLAAVVRGTEKWLGTPALACLIFPSAFADSVRRWRHLRGFAHLRDILPASFWSCAAWRHFLRITQTWQEVLTLVLLQDRLDSPRWRERLTHSGSAPNEIAVWGQRPVIVTFIHTGAFALLRYWLRARGIPAAMLLRARPQLMIRSAEFEQRADDRYDLHGVPPYFDIQSELRDAVRFLEPGRVLVVALDGAHVSEKVEPCLVNGHPILLQDGAVRLARHADAVMIPATVQRRGFLRFEVQFGPQVPDELVRQRNSRPAMQYLADILWAQAASNPIGIAFATLEALAPDRAYPHALWP